MNISELIRHQVKWEGDRGIKNKNYGIDRVQEEVDEVREEPDLSKKLVEYADILIIVLGSVGGILEYLDLEPEAFEDVIRNKVDQNSIKYDLDGWDFSDVEGSIQRARETWYNLDR